MKGQGARQDAQRRRRLLFAVCAVAFALLEASADAVTWIELDIAAIYGIPLVLAAIARSRCLLWVLTLLLTVTTFSVYAFQIPNGVFWLGETFFVNRLLDAAAVLLTARLLHIWMNSLDIAEAQARLLDDQNDRLEAANAELLRHEALISRQNEELDQRRRQAEEASERKTLLLASASHDIRGPVNTINLMAEVIRRTAEDPDLAPGVGRLAEHLQASALSLVNLVSAMLDAAHFESGHVQCRENVFSLNELILSSCRDWLPAAQAKQLRLQSSIPAETIWLRTDQFKLQRVISNLISNAIKFTETGSVRLAVELLEQTADDYRIRFSVTDTGIGIPESFRAKMFEPFSQADQGISRRYGGTGLGLALSKRIIELMRGELAFESTPGHGTRFWFELSLKRTTATDTATEAVPTDIVRGKRILVADDNASNLVLLKELLELDQHEVTTCTSGMAALETLAKRDFDLLLLDYNLGDMDGVRVLQTYRFGRLHPVPVLFLNADATVQTATRLQEAGGAGILYKPVTIAGIREALAAVAFPSTAHATPDLASGDGKPVRPALSVVPSSPLNESVIDELRRISARPDFLSRLLTQAESDIERCCEQLLEALAERNFVALRAAAHALKGVSANVGAVRLTSLTSTLMKMASEDIAPVCDRLAADVRDACRATVLALRKIADSGVKSVQDVGLLHPD